MDRRLFHYCIWPLDTRLPHPKDYKLNRRDPHLVHSYITLMKDYINHLKLPQ